MTTGLQRRQAGRFQSDYDDPALIELVREVTKQVNPVSPHTVSPNRFNDALDANAEAPRPRWPNALRADTIRRRLGRLGWYELLALIWDPDRSTERYLATIRRREGRHVTDEDAVAALKTIAGRLDVSTLRPHEFTAERADLVAEDERARHGGSAEVSFPTAAQIEAVFRTDTEPGWDRALVAAGLEPRLRLLKRTTVPLVQACELFLCDVGCLPWGWKAMDEYGRRKGIAIEARRDGKKLRVADACDTLRKERALLGLWTPPRPAPHTARPELDTVFEPDADLPRRGHGKGYWFDRERLVAGVTKAYDIAAQRGFQLRQPTQRQLAKEFSGDIPHPSVVDRNAKTLGTTAEEIHAEAKRRHSARRRS